MGAWCTNSFLSLSMYVCMYVYVRSLYVGGVVGVMYEK